MRRIATLFGIAALGVTLACDDAPDTGPAAPQIQSTAEDLIDLLPGSTLAAFELIDVVGRWDELRADSRFAHLQDRLLDDLGLEAEDIPEIAGQLAVFALVSDESSRRVVPIAVLDPPSPNDALARLAESDVLVAIEARGAIWAGAASHAHTLERIALGDGTSIRQTVDFATLSERLPPGGLVRAVVNPRAVRDYLLRWASYAGGKLVGKLAALIGADLEAIEVIGFRRDLVDGVIVTDAWVEIDDAVAPDAMIRALAADRGPPLLPTHLPEKAVIVKAFRTEPEAGLAWLRALADRNPDGPLRNLDFWIDEFEARSGRDVESDIVEALGERGLSLLLEGEGQEGVDFAMILDADAPERLEGALIDLRDWLAELIAGRSLGLVIHQNRDAVDRSGAVHGFDFRGPFVRVSGPVFQLVDDRLVIATSRHSLDLGVELARAAATWATPDWAFINGPPDEVALIRTSAVARLLDGGSTSAHESRWLGDIVDFLAGVGDGRVGVYYEERGFRISSQLDIGAAKSSAVASQR